MTSPITPLCLICRTFGKRCCKLHKDKYRADCKLLCGTHPAYVDPFNGHHPMFTAPVPSAHDDDVTVLEHRSLA